MLVCELAAIGERTRSTLSTQTNDSCCLTHRVATPAAAPLAPATREERPKTPEGFYQTHGERLGRVEQDVVGLRDEMSAIRSDVQAMRAELSSFVAGLEKLCIQAVSKPT